MKKLCYISVRLESNLQLPATLDDSGILLGLCHFHHQQLAMDLTVEEIRCDDVGGTHSSRMATDFLEGLLAPKSVEV